MRNVSKTKSARAIIKGLRLRAGADVDDLERDLGGLIKLASKYQRHSRKPPPSKEVSAQIQRLDRALQDLSRALGNLSPEAYQSAFGRHLNFVRYEEIETLLMHDEYIASDDRADLVLALLKPVKERLVGLRTTKGKRGPKVNAGVNEICWELANIYSHATGRWPTNPSATGGGEFTKFVKEFLRASGFVANELVIARKAVKIESPYAN